MDLIALDTQSNMQSDTIHARGSMNELSMKDAKQNRWEMVDFGFIHIILTKIFKNVSYRLCGILTILTTVILSISDTISDLVIAISLFARRYTTLGWAVLVVDFVPGWVLAMHNSFSPKWRAAETVKQKVVTTVCLIFSPFSTALFHLRWLCRFERAEPKEFELLQHNARLSGLLNGSYESPMQIILLLVIWGQDKIALPWSSETCVKDSQNRIVCLGAIPGILSLSISLLSILKGSIDISEGQNWTEKGITCVYSLCNFAFRLPSIALAILYFYEWSLFIFIPIWIINLIMIVRFDKDKRKGLSVTTSIIVATITPFVTSDQTNLYQRTDIETDSAQNREDNQYRRKLAANLSMVISPVLFAGDLILFLLLRYHKDFNYNGKIIMETYVTEKILSIFLLPLGGMVMIANFMYRQPIPQMNEPNPEKWVHHKNRDTRQVKPILSTSFQVFGFMLLFLGVFVSSGITIHSILSTKGICILCNEIFCLYN